MGKSFRFWMQCRCSVLMLTVFVLGSCTASRGVMQHHVNIMTDNMVTEASGEELKRVCDVDSMHSLRTDSNHVANVVDEKEENNEVITEHIEDRVDSMGNRVVTTDRTINRRGTKNTHSSYDEWRTNIDERTDLLFHKIDSLSKSSEKAVSHHSELKDSLYEERERSASNPVSWIESIWDRFECCALIISLTLIVVTFYYHKNKK